MASNRQGAQSIFAYLGANVPADLDQARQLLHLKTLVLIDSNGNVVWQPVLNFQSSEIKELVMQSDGNLVMYKNTYLSSTPALWATSFYPQYSIISMAGQPTAGR